MNTISNRMNKILLFVLFFYILDSILLFPARTNLIYMMAFILFRAGFLTAAAFVVKLYVIRPLGKTEKAMDDYVSGRIGLEQLCEERPITPACDRFYNI